MPEGTEGETPQPDTVAETPEQTSQQTGETKVTPSGTGLEPNVAGALSYVLGLITGIIFWVTEQENRFVRFHAMQSILFCVTLVVTNIVLDAIPIFGWALSSLVNLAALVVWLMLMYKAYNNEEWELPVLGGIAKKQVSK